jgi:hypothetical protein
MRNSTSKYIACVFLLTIVVVQQSLSQSKTVSGNYSFYASLDNIEKAEKRKLLVELTDESEVNDKLIEAVKEFWKFNSEYEIVSHTALLDSLNKCPSKYTILGIKYIEGNTINYRSIFLRFSIYLGEKYMNMKDVYFVDILPSRNLGHLAIKRQDAIFALCYIQNHFEARKKHIIRFGYTEIRSYQHELEKKTLLLDSVLFSRKLNVDKIPEDYHLRYKICSSKDIEEALMKRDGLFACAQTIPVVCDSDIRMYYVLDCANCHILSYGDMFNGFGDFGFSNYINGKQLRLFEQHSGFDFYTYGKKSDQ